VTVVAGGERAGDGLDGDRWRALAGAVLIDEGAAGELDLAFVTEDEMADLNRAHMGREGPTDVLAFPLDGEAGEEDGNDQIPRLLGDVVICPSVARDHAAEHGVGVEDELALLVVHGVLHVLGWDHATDEERVAMQGRERHHLDRWRAAARPPTGAAGP
jgi:probable rRNA maturation factor